MPDCVFCNLRFLSEDLLLTWRSDSMYVLMQSRQQPHWPVVAGYADLLPNSILDLADLCLNFAGSVFLLAIGFQGSIRADFHTDLLDIYPSLCVGCLLPRPSCMISWHVCHSS
jgi:hypothetical protein